MSDSFDWNYAGLDWSQFHSLTNLLSLRNGGQAEPSSLSDTVLIEDWDAETSGDEDTPSIKTTSAHQISYSGHGKLKQKFLDCLAEFAANKKGGTAVACSAMKEGEDNVVVWIARNQGFSDADKVVLTKLGEWLASLFSKNADQVETLLWEQMVFYHQKRIETSHIPDLTARFEDYDYDAIRSENDTNIEENDSISGNNLSVLRTLLCQGNNNGKSNLENHTKLVIASYNVLRTRSIEKLLYSSPSATSKSKRLWEHICLLARLRVAFQNFKDIALTLSSFEQATMVLVSCPLEHAKLSQRPLNLEQTFAIL